MNNIKWFPKIGEKVNVCYDGKISRAVSGTIEKIKGFMIQVSFLEWGESKPELVKCWCPRNKYGYYSTYLRTDHSFMKTALGLPGDFYSIYPLEDK